MRPPLRIEREARLAYQTTPGETPLPRTEQPANSMEDLGRMFGETLQRATRSVQAALTSYNESHTSTSSTPAAPNGTRFARMWDAFLRAMQQPTGTPASTDTVTTPPATDVTPTPGAGGGPAIVPGTPTPTPTPTSTPTPRSTPEAPLNPDQIRERAQAMKQATDAAFAEYTSASGDPTTTDVALVTRTKQAISTEMLYRGTHSAVLNDNARYDLVRGMWPQLYLHDMLVRARTLKQASDAAYAAYVPVQNNDGPDRVQALQAMITANEAEETFLKNNAARDNANVNGKGFPDFIGEPFYTRLTNLQRALPEWRARLSDRFRQQRQARGETILRSRSDEWESQTRSGQQMWVQKRTFVSGYAPRLAFIEGQWKINHDGNSGSFEALGNRVRTGYASAQANAMISVLQQVNANNFTVEAPPAPATPEPPAEGLPLG